MAKKVISRHRAAAKFGWLGALIALTHAMAIELAPENIRGISISPGTVDSPMLRAAVAAEPNPRTTRQAFDDIQPRRRVGTKQEVANVF